ncbi:hypothetical protein MKW98_017927 [Papaver atlanticum]|uniref:Uncharacterized protein n=1 Tax=Papaver atlanticum TaxID=357466 RepID=A0AAD4TC58_9MAGN|nr:hypothetical protein MKW98_017927 [Papaver atlanticum]
MESWASHSLWNSLAEGSKDSALNVNGFSNYVTTITSSSTINSTVQHQFFVFYFIPFSIINPKHGEGLSGSKQKSNTTRSGSLEETIWKNPDQDWDDIKFAVDNKVDFYEVFFVKDAEVVDELKVYLKVRIADYSLLLRGVQKRDCQNLATKNAKL